MRTTKDHFEESQVEYIRQQFLDQLGFCPIVEVTEYDFQINIGQKISIDLGSDHCAPLYMRHYVVYGPPDYDAGEKYAYFDNAVERAIELYLMPGGGGEDDWDYDPPSPQSPTTWLSPSRPELVLAV